MAGSEGATVVLVHGALCGAWIWEPLGKELDTRDIAHVEVDLPSVGFGVDPTNDAHGDAAHLRQVLNSIDAPIVVCGNSYGGVVITEAAAGHQRVAHLVYLAAFMPDADDDLASFLPGNCTPEMTSIAVPTDDGLIAADPEALTKVASQQASAELGEWAAARFRPMAAAAIGASGSVTGVAWREIPSTCVVCTEDRAIEPESQRRWAKERASYTIEVPFDHGPQVSHPAEIADILAKIVSDLRV